MSLRLYRCAFVDLRLCADAVHLFVVMPGGIAKSVLSGLTLEQCLDAYTKEETLEEEDSWYCSSCEAHRRGVMKIDLWKMPDVLVGAAMHVIRRDKSRRGSRIFCNRTSKGRTMSDVGTCSVMATINMVSCVAQGSCACDS